MPSETYFSLCRDLLNQNSHRNGADNEIATLAQPYPAARECVEKVRFF